MFTVTGKAEVGPAAPARVTALPRSPDYPRTFAFWENAHVNAVRPLVGMPPPHPPVTSLSSPPLSVSHSDFLSLSHPCLFSSALGIAQLAAVGTLGVSAGVLSFLGNQTTDRLPHPTLNPASSWNAQCPVLQILPWRGPLPPAPVEGC